ncbi:PIR protein [Plasmodium yoelii]|uniref:PIR protein n=2 Tax=Plasmodium yoelii TaxID=5861 RepID=A0AAF0AZD4_PLAYO|nr:PIR protein [Plasmodium yoelii]WBY56487.1 PIR protein [Plasmodium yoelii yoelii]CDU17356.1 YIR protein [Plasmodium yoelii]VTZ76648.1 PIR protein [Plasmodium yoelii]|eukprot:XP_022811866.1 PIR protein [Plasmodium yoelii]
MNKKVSQHFKSVWGYFPDELTNDGNYNFLFNGQHFKQYCTNNSCDSNLEQINSACLYLFNAFFGDFNSYTDNAKKKIDIVYYIIIWLSYMLSLKKENEINKLNDFYTKHIEKNEHYNKKIQSVRDYECYKELINKKKDLLNMDNYIISNFYKAFKLLCEMYSEYGENTLNCKKCSNKAIQFVEKYKELNGDSNNNDSSPYKKILSTLSNDYDNLKNECKDAKDSNFPALKEISTPQDTIESIGQTTEQIGQTEQKSDVTSSSSSIVSKLIPVVSIFVAISFFLGISYKYSLFGFRKRSQKHLREKLKK